MNNGLESLTYYICIETYFLRTKIMLGSPVNMVTSTWYLHMWKLNMCSFLDHCPESAEEHKHVFILLCMCFQNVQWQKQIRTIRMTTCLCWSAGSGKGITSVTHNYKFICQEHGIAQRAIYCRLLNFTAQIMYAFTWRVHVRALSKIWAFHFSA